MNVLEVSVTGETAQRPRFIVSAIGKAAQVLARGRGLHAAAVLEDFQDHGAPLLPIGAADELLEPRLRVGQRVALTRAMRRPGLYKRDVSPR